MMKRILIGLCTCTLALALACTRSGVPTSPNAANVTDGAAAADGSTLKIGAPTLNAPVNGVQGPAGSSDPVTLVVNNVSGTYTAFTVTYEFEVKNPAGAVVANPKVVAGASTTSTVIAATSLASDTSYSWRARATYQTAFGPWSLTRTFRTPVPEGFFGQTVIDPLTNGKTYGKQRGGRFVSGGWQATSMADGIDYDIPTLVTGTVEFDVTNIGPMEGQCCNADLKLLSMGDANAFGGFGAFRDHPWKMHLVQRADNTGLEIIWRNGGTDPEGNPGDHRVKMPCCGPEFRSTIVNHFVLKWDPYGYTISASTDGGPLIEYMDGDFGGYWYEPENHRISLGCYPRGETIVGIVYRNIKIRPGNQ